MVKTPKQPYLPLGLLVVGGIIIGASPILVRLSEVGPLATAFWRSALACAILMPFQHFRLEPGSSSDRNAALRLALPGLFLAFDLLLWHLAINKTAVANATLLANLAPFFVAIASYAIFGERIQRVALLGMLCAGIGMVVLVGGLTGLATGTGGNAMAVAAALFYAAYILSVGKLRLHFGASQIMFWTTLSSAVVTLPIAVSLEHSFVPNTIYGWCILLMLGLFCHALGQLAIAFALAYLPASLSALTLMLQPVVAALLGVLVLNENLLPNQLVGGGLVLAGIVLAAMRGKSVPQQSRRLQAPPPELMKDVTPDEPSHAINPKT